MQQVRVAFYTLKPGTADEVVRRAEADLVRRFRNEAGFVAYGLVKTGDDAVISLQTFKDAEAILAGCLQLQTHLLEQDKTLTEVVERLETMVRNGRIAGRAED
jgi:hypothetical protein